MVGGFPCFFGLFPREWQGGGPSFGWLAGRVPVLGLRVWDGVLCVCLEGGAAAPVLVRLLEGSRSLGWAQPSGSEVGAAAPVSVGLPEGFLSSGSEGRAVSHVVMGLAEGARSLGTKGRAAAPATAGLVEKARSWGSEGRALSSVLGRGRPALGLGG